MAVQPTVKHIKVHSGGNGIAMQQSQLVRWDNFKAIKPSEHGSDSTAKEETQRLSQRQRGNTWNLASFLIPNWQHDNRLSSLRKQMELASVNPSIPNLFLDPSTPAFLLWEAESDQWRAEVLNVRNFKKRATSATPPKVLQMKDSPPYMSTTTCEDSTSSPSLQVTAQMKASVRAEANPPPSPSPPS